MTRPGKKERKKKKKRKKPTANTGIEPMSAVLEADLLPLGQIDGRPFDHLIGVRNHSCSLPLWYRDSKVGYESGGCCHPLFYVGKTALKCVA